MQLSDQVNTLFVLISFFLCILAAFKLIDTSVNIVRVLLFFSLSHGRIAFGVISVALGRYKNLPQPIRLNETAIINTSFVFVGCSGFSSFPHQESRQVWMEASTSKLLTAVTRFLVVCLLHSLSLSLLSPLVTLLSPLATVRFLACWPFCKLYLLSYCPIWMIIHFLLLFNVE